MSPRVAGVALALTAAIVVPAGASAASAGAPAAVLILTPASREVAFGSSVTLAGSLTSAGSPLAGQTVELQAARFPFRVWRNATHTVTAADGSFRFVAQHPDRNTRYRAHLVGAATVSATELVLVDAVAQLRARSQGPGRVLLTVVVAHSRAFDWRGTTVYWYLAAPRTRVWRLVSQTRAGDLRPGVTLGSTIVNPPTRRFAFRACLNPPGEQALGPASAHHRCRQGDYTVNQRVR